jgi:putative transposase
MRAVRADFETEPVEFNGENNHLHPLMHFPPNVALSKLVNSLTGVSSQRTRQEFPDLARHYYRANRLWSGSYFAGSVAGAPLRVLHQYIEQQHRPVSGTARALAALPARAFTPALKGAAPARILVASAELMRLTISRAAGSLDSRSALVGWSGHRRDGRHVTFLAAARAALIAAVAIRYPVGLPSVPQVETAQEPPRDIASRVVHPHRVPPAQRSRSSAVRTTRYVRGSRHPPARPGPPSRRARPIPAACRARTRCRRCRRAGRRSRRSAAAPSRS